MSATRSESGLRRLDLKKSWTSSLLPWLRARAGWLRARLTPADPVLLRHPDGSQSVWMGNARIETAETGKKPSFVAVEIPDELLLRRSLTLPQMSQADMDAALVLEVRSNSPFAADDLAWGSLTQEAEGGHRRAEIVIASRRQISDFIRSRWPDLSAGQKQPEAWAVSGLPAPVVIAGYGEQQRLQHQSTQKQWDLALLFLGCVLAALAALTPTAQLRLRALEAGDAFGTVMKRVAPLVRKRDELAVLTERLRSLDAAVADRVDPAGVIEYLTQALPDDTHLYSLDIQKAKITASGHTVDASALLQKLSSDPRLKDVRSPTAVTRMPGATKEAFTVEFTMDMKQVAVSPPSASAAAGPAVAAAVATPPMPSASAPATAAATGVPSAAAVRPPGPAVAPAASRFVIGGSSR
ncbi:MAG: PilN domain-containing protein [Ramlibacter sp.]